MADERCGLQTAASRNARQNICAFVGIHQTQDFIITQLGKRYVSCFVGVSASADFTDYAVTPEAV